MRSSTRVSLEQTSSYSPSLLAQYAFDFAACLQGFLLSRQRYKLGFSPLLGFAFVSPSILSHLRRSFAIRFATDHSTSLVLYFRHRDWPIHEPTKYIEKNAPSDACHSSCAVDRKLPSFVHGTRAPSSSSQSCWLKIALTIPF